MNVQEIENDEHERGYNPQDRFAGFDRGDAAELPKVSSPATGSLISGTLRMEDLIPAFMAELRRLEGVIPDEIDGEFREWQRSHLESGDKSQDNLEQEQELFDTLATRLDAFAPPGHYFGAHEGDGADFGFWPDGNQDTPEPPSALASVGYFEACLNVLRALNISPAELVAYQTAKDFIEQAKDGKCTPWNYTEMAFAAEMDDPRDRISMEFDDILKMVAHITGEEQPKGG